MVSGIFLLFFTGHLPVLDRQTQRQHINIYWIYFSVPSKFSALGSFSHLARKFKMTHFLVSARRRTSSKCSFLPIDKLIPFCITHVFTCYLVCMQFPAKLLLLMPNTILLLF